MEVLIYYAHANLQKRSQGDQNRSSRRRGVFALRALAVIATVLFVTTIASAGTFTIEGAGTLSVAVTCDLPATDTEHPEIAGRVSIAPVSEEMRSVPMILYVNGAVRGLTSDTRGQFELDADDLGEGEHTVRVDAVEGEQLIASTGSIPFTVISSARAAERQAAAQAEPLGGPRPVFQKLYRPRIYREIVYFNNREGDLERHAVIRNGRVYITLTDLMRHIGGSIIWGPRHTQMEVHRNDVVVTVYPNSRRVLVNGVARTLDRSTFRKENRTWVPVRPFANLFGIVTEWDFQEDRAYVIYQQ